MELNQNHVVPVLNMQNLQEKASKSHFHHFIHADADVLV